MLTRFITWLVVRFLSQTDLLKIVSDRLMLKGRDHIVMQNLYTVHDENRNGDIDHMSFNELCMAHLMSRFSTTALCSIFYLKMVKARGRYCADATCDDLRDTLTKIHEAIDEKNYLKRQTNVKEILRGLFIDVTEEELNILTTIAIQSNYTPESALAFIKHV